MKEIKKVHIPEKTRKEMADFFMKHSIPRILADSEKNTKNNKPPTQ